VNKKKLFLFDVDGVLFDTKKNMEKSWQKVCDKFRLQIPFEKYFNLIGIPFKKILINLGIKDNFFLIQKYYKKCSIKNNRYIKIYPSVRETIKKIKNRGDKIGIVTSKDYYRTKLLLNRFKIDISLVECHSKNKRGKPHPDTLNSAIKKSLINKKKVYYVGDTQYDLLAAQRAKIKFIFASYGYGKVIKIKKNFIINKFHQVLSF